MITDIANFFDTLLHSHVDEAVRGIKVHPRMIGSLFFLLERLSIRQDYSQSNAISLPVDEFDCSRILAHMALYPHDDAMVALVGEDNYIRWMDDQNMGVDSKAQGLLVLAEVVRSLSRLHLTPNSNKSKVLSLAEVRRHYHLDLNRLLDASELLAREVQQGGKDSARKLKPLKLLRKRIREFWPTAKQNENAGGEFPKILKRTYRLAGIAGLRFLRSRALRDVLADPALTGRVCHYMRCTGKTGEYVAFVEELQRHPEQIYPDVNVGVLESLLRIEPESSARGTLRQIGSEALRKAESRSDWTEAGAVGPLVVLRFGDRRSLPLLEGYFKGPRRTAGPAVIRAAAAVYASFGKAEFAAVRRAAASFLRTDLRELVLMVHEIQRYSQVPDRYKSRLRAGYDSITGRSYVDMRVLLTVRLLLLNDHVGVRRWVRDWRSELLKRELSEFDRDLITRMLSV